MHARRSVRRRRSEQISVPPFTMSAPRPYWGALNGQWRPAIMRWHAEKPPSRGRKRLRRENAALKRCSTSRNDQERIASVTVCLRCLVSGRVQGVFFRAATREKARQVGVDVRPINLADGRVEVLIWGESAQVERLRAWLWQGPPAARVDDVHCTPVDANAFEPN